MTYYEALKLLRKNRIIVISKIIEKWYSIKEESSCETKTTSDLFSEDILFSFYFTKNAEYSVFRNLGINVDVKQSGQCFCSVKYLGFILENFSDRIMMVHSPNFRIPVSFFNSYLKTIENLIELFSHDSSISFYFLENEDGLRKCSVFSYIYIYDDIEWNLDIVEQYKDIINWKLLIEKSNILWTESMIVRFMSYIPFCVEGDTYCDMFKSNKVIQDFSQIGFLSNEFIEKNKDSLDFHDFLSSANFLWDSEQMAHFYNWSINIQIPHSKVYPNTKEGTQFKYGHSFFECLVLNPNFIWTTDLLLTAIKLDSTMLEVFIGKGKENIRRIIESIPNYQELLKALPDGDTFFMQLEDGGEMPFGSYSANFNLNNIKQNIEVWNEVLSDKFIRTHRLSSDTYFYVNQVRTLWNYYDENPNVKLTYEICEYLVDKNICIGGVYEKEYRDQDYLDDGFYTKETNALSYFAHKRIKGKNELKKIYSNLALCEKLLVGGNEDIIDDLLDIMIKEYGINELVAYIIDDNKLENDFEE